MPTNTNYDDSKQHCGLYKPPHLRKGYVNNAVLQKNNTSKYDLNNLNDFKDLKISQVKTNNNATNGGRRDQYSKTPTQPFKRNHFNLGLSSYFDCKFKGTHEEYLKKLQESNTLYIGNLNLASTKSDIHQLFANAGTIKTIIMGLDKKTLSPAGFCFIEYEVRSGAENCKNIMDGVVLHGQKLFVDWDAGFIEGRQYRRNNFRNQQKSMVVYPKGSPGNNNNRRETTSYNRYSV